MMKGEENQQQQVPNKKEKEPNMEGIYHFSWPRLNTTLWPEQQEQEGDNADGQEQIQSSVPEGRVKIDKIFAGSNYCYALCESENKLYSWGMGYNYVLGSREEDNLFTPTVVHPKQFHENIVKLVGTGAQHIVVLTTDSPDNRELPAFEMVPIKEEEKPKEIETKAE